MLDTEQLTKENEHLSRLLSRMSWYANIPQATGIDEVDNKREKEWEEFQNALEGMRKGPLLFELEAENERLKNKMDTLAESCAKALLIYKKDADEKQLQWHLLAQKANKLKSIYRIISKSRRGSSVVE